ncbi:MAG: Ig-like domain-containing protein, partial [Marmoricola sp.]
FAYTESESSATVECQLDAAGFLPCDSPVGYAGLTAGAHTFDARATDTVGNVSAATSYTWTVNLTIPTIAIAFPTVAGLYNDAGFNAGCGTASTGDVCGSADDDVAVTAVRVSLHNLTSGKWWNGTSFAASTETWLTATGTTDWAYAIAASALPEGDFTLRAQVSDGSNFGYDSRTFTVDRTAPATPTLTSVPPATSGPSATFAFTTTDPTAGFECQLDSGGFASCSSPQVYGNLSHGSHTVNVRAVDGAGNASAGTSTTWTVDATPPTAAMTFPTATRYNLAGWAAGCGTPATGDICGTASDVGSGLTQVDVSIRRASTNSYWDGSTFSAASETWQAATGTTSWSFLFAGTSFPSDGSYTVRWRATDAVGNVTTGGVDLTIDTTPPPAPQIVHAPSDPGGSAAQFDFTDAEAGTGAECRLDSGSWATCVSPVAYSGLAGGSHTFGVRATDAAGNVSATTSYTWTVNVGLPNISVSFPAADGSYNNTTYAAGCSTPADDICGTAADPGGSVAGVALSIRRASTSLYWNGTSFTSASEVFLPATGTTSWSFAMAAASFPADDSYTLNARATDNVGLTAFDSQTLIIDRTAPSAPTITSGPSGTTAGNDAFSFTGEASASFECRLDAGSWAACTSPKTYGALTDGSHTFDVRAIDGAGNVGAAASRTWTVDTTAPTIGTTFPVAGTRYITTTYDAGCVAGTGDICGTASDAGSGVGQIEVSVQRASTGLYLTGTTFSASGQNWITATGTTSWSLAIAATTLSTDGTYTLVVRATDGVGNANTSSTAFVIDRTKPTAADFTTTNFLTLRMLELKDTFTLTYSEAMNPASIIAGWDGTTTQNVVVRATNNSTSDKLTIYNSTNSTLLPLGTVTLKRTDYVSASLTFGLTGTASTLTMSGSSFTITLGTASKTASVKTAAAAANASWAPSATAKDLAGNAAATTAYVETDLDSDF